MSSIASKWPMPYADLQLYTILSPLSKVGGRREAVSRIII
jgi:hypothetical protein